MSIVNLPPELLVNILDHVNASPSNTRLQDIYNLCHIRPFIPAARECLYYDPGAVMRWRHHGFFSLPHLVSLVRTVVQNPHLGALVRNFTFDLIYEHSTSFRLSPHDEAFFLGVIKSLGLKLCGDACLFHPAHKTVAPTLPTLLLAHCPNVDTARFAPEDALAHFFRCSPWEEQLGRWRLAFPGHRALKSLTLHFEREWKYELADIACILQMGSLESLRLSRLNIAPCRGLFDAKASTALRKGASPIRRLRLHQIIAAPPVLFSMLNCFPALSELIFDDRRVWRPRYHEPTMDADADADEVLPPPLSPLFDVVKKHKKTIRMLALLTDFDYLCLHAGLAASWPFHDKYVYDFCSWVGVESLRGACLNMQSPATPGSPSLVIIREIVPNISEFSEMYGGPGDYEFSADYMRLLKDCQKWDPSQPPWLPHPTRVRGIIHEKAKPGELEAAIANSGVLIIVHSWGYVFFW